MTDYRRLAEAANRIDDTVKRLLAEREEMQSAIEALQAENERLELALEKACRKSEEFQARLDAMGKGEAVGEWKHCSPELLASGVSCRDTPRRPCECDHGGSHDHWIAAPKALEPLSYAEIEVARREWLESGDMGTAYHSAVRFAERHHGIGGTP